MANKCPLCHVDNKPSAKFCGTCGTSLPGEPAAGGEEEYSLLKRLGYGTVALFCECFPGLFSPMVLVMSIAVAIVGLAIMGMAGWIFALGAMITAFMIGAFGVIAYWTACTWIVCGYMCLPSEGLSDMRGVQWYAFFLLGFGPLVGILAYMAQL